MRYTISGRSTVVPTATRAGISIFGANSFSGTIREVGIYSTVNTHCTLALCAFTSATNVGAALRPRPHNIYRNWPSNLSYFAGHTGDGGPWAVTSYSFARQAMLPAAIGGGHVWPFGDDGLVVPFGSTNGWGIICSTGTGQIFDFHIDVDE